MTVRPDARAKLNGHELYTADVALPGLCHAALVRSPVPHARILAVDANQARAQPGVLGVFTFADFPARLFGRRVRDIPILTGEPRFIGDRVAVAVAETRLEAEAAASLVELDYEELPAVLDADAALVEGAPTVHQAPWSFPGAVVAEGQGANLQALESHGSRVEVEAALAASAYVVDSIYTTPSGHQGYLEPQAAVASVSDDGIQVWAANKSPYALRRQLAEGFELPADSIVVQPVAVGGDFGGKGSPLDAPLCVELSRRVGRPVKLVQRSGEDLTAANPRHSSRVRVRLGSDAAGNLTALSVEVVADGGAYAGFKPVPTLVPHGFMEAGSVYRIPAASAEARVAYTNTVPRGHMRAPGAPQVVFAVESAVDELALALGIPPEELRRRNLLRTGEANPQGDQPVEARGREVLEAAVAGLQPLSGPEGWLTGAGLAIYDRRTTPGSISLRLSSEASGRLLLEVPFPEQGGGSHAAARSGLARALGVPAEMITVRQVATDQLPHDDGVGGTRVTASLSRALGRAAAEWAASDGGPVTVLLEREPLPSHRSSCAQVAQVAVDPRTGCVRVLQLVTAADVAEVLNPIAHRLQLEGGAAMGYGFACLEDLLIAEGQVGAASLGEFRLPAAADVPRWRTVLVEGGKGIGELNVKAAGELSNVPVAAAIANAVAAATGVRIRDLPITAEKVWLALQVASPA